MKSKKIDANKLRLAQLKYFDEAHNGVEVNGLDAYAFLYNSDGHYINPFDSFTALPVYERLPYSNTTRDGEDFGSKIIYVQGDKSSGPCYVMGNTTMRELFGAKEITEEVLKNYIIKSRKFFIDRPVLMRALSKKDLRRYQDKLIKDAEMMDRLTEFFESHEEEQIHK